MKAKELSIEEKARRYDEAIEELRGLLDGVHEEKCDIMEGDIVKIFPELAESEDEKIRKELIDFVKSRLAGFSECDRFITWLEKQCEQKPAWSEEDEKEFEQLLNILHANGYESFNIWLKSLKDKVQPRPNQEWGEEDEKCIRLSTDIIDSALRAGFCVQLDRDRCVDWLKSLRPQNHWKPSNEQMKFLWKYAEQNNYDGSILTSLYNDLKKLRMKGGMK